MASTSQNVELFSGEAGSVVRAYRFVVMAAGDGQYDEVGVAQAEMDGIAAESVSDVGSELPIVAMKGGTIAKVCAGATFSRGATLASDNQGRAIAAVSTAGNWEAGKALDAATAIGDIVRIQLLKQRDQA